MNYKTLTKYNEFVPQKSGNKTATFRQKLSWLKANYKEIRAKYEKKYKK